MFKDGSHNVQGLLFLFVKSPFSYVGTASCQNSQCIAILFFKKLTIIALGFILNLTLYGILVGYSELAKQGARK